MDTKAFASPVASLVEGLESQDKGLYSWSGTQQGKRIANVQENQSGTVLRVGQQNE